MLSTLFTIYCLGLIVTPVFLWNYNDRHKIITKHTKFEEGFTLYMIALLAIIGWPIVVIIYVGDVLLEKIFNKRK